MAQSSIEDFCKHAHGILQVTTRTVAQELGQQAAPQSEEVVQAVREVLKDDLYQDPLQVGR